MQIKRLIIGKSK